MTIAARTVVLGLMLVQAGVAATDVSIPVSLPDVSVKQVQSIEPKLPARTRTIYSPRRLIEPAKDLPTYIPVNGLDDLFGGWENFGVAVAPDQVELVRLRQVKKEASASEDFYEEGAKVLPLEDAVELRVALTSDSTYNWEQDNACTPEYAFRVKFRQDKKLVSVDLCFECRTLRVVKDGREIAAKNFEFGCDVLAAVIERYYPGVLVEFISGERPYTYSARRIVPPKEEGVLTAQKAEQLIAAADKVLISSEMSDGSRDRFVADRDWIQRVAKAVGASQIASKHHCFCVGWPSASFSRNGEDLITISAIHGHQLRISSNIANGDYTIDESQWKAVASVLDEQKLAALPTKVPTDP